MIELTDEELLVATDEDWAFYKKVIEGLPTMAGKNNDGLDKFGVHIPYHSGPHILRHFRDTIELIKPKRILEIGLNMGHSAAMWLNLCDAFVYSVDISLKDETLEGGEVLLNRFKERFEYRVDPQGDHYSRLQHSKPFDLVFIDGSHEADAVTADIQLAKDMNIPYLLFDDWYPRYGDIQKAVAKFPELELVKDMNNLRLYKFSNL